MTEPSFPIQFSHKGRTVTVQATLSSTAADLLHHVQTHLELDRGDVAVKLLYKGKRIVDTATAAEGEATAVFDSVPRTTPKILVLVTPKRQVEALNAKRSDPTIRGLDQEIERERKQREQNNNNNNAAAASNYWETPPDRNYKFCRFQACTWQSFGHRAGEATPHDFAARALLERLATDPGVVAVLKTRQLVVGTLGEMDPIDDRVMQQQQQQQPGSCLLGYNSNAGQRIDVKLRTDDLQQGFRPYPDLVCTLLHELSHNWCGAHDLLFWTNLAQMRAEYLCHHLFREAGRLVRGQTTAQLAELDAAALRTPENVFERICEELVPDMAPHGLHPRSLAPGLRRHVYELHRQTATTTTTTAATAGGSAATASDAREMARAAAGRRARERQQQQSKKEENDTKRRHKE